MIGAALGALSLIVYLWAGTHESERVPVVAPTSARIVIPSEGPPVIDNDAETQFFVAGNSWSHPRCSILVNGHIILEFSEEFGFVDVSSLVRSESYVTRINFDRPDNTSGGHYRGRNQGMVVSSVIGHEKLSPVYNYAFNPNTCNNCWKASEVRNLIVNVNGTIFVAGVEQLKFVDAVYKDVWSFRVGKGSLCNLSRSLSCIGRDAGEGEGYLGVSRLFTGASKQLDRIEREDSIEEDEKPVGYVVKNEAIVPSLLLASGVGFLGLPLVGLKLLSRNERLELNENGKARRNRLDWFGHVLIWGAIFGIPLGWAVAIILSMYADGRL